MKTAVILPVRHSGGWGSINGRSGIPHSLISG
jgi:hypothetical protein